VEHDVDLDTLWSKLQEEVHKGEINQPLWDALRAAKPVVLENDVLAVGIESADYGRVSSYLKTAVTKNMLEKILRQLTGNPKITLQVFEGTSRESWERAKTVAQHMSATVAARAQAQREVTELAADWDKIGEQIHSLYASVENRRFAQVAAQFMLQALEMLADAEERIVAAGGAPEVHVRRLGRTLDKIASYVEMPATAVGLEYLRIKERRQRSS